MLLFQAIALVRASVGFILVLSAVGKLLDPRGTRQAVAEYGAPLRTRQLLVWLLPPLELLTGTALVLHLMPLVSSIVALLLFLSFLVGVLRVLARGKVMDCHCFGALTRERIGSLSLLRLALLIALAVGVLVADVITLRARGVVFIGPAIDGASTLIPIAIAAGAAAFGFVLIGQVAATYRTIASTRVSRDGER